MDHKIDNYNQDNTEETNFVEVIIKYFSFWPWFILSIFICVSSCLIYLRYAPNIFESSTKILILDKKQTLELPTEELLEKKINLENEIETINSFPIIERVVKSLNLHYEFSSVGNIKSLRALDLPFSYEVKLPVDSITKNQTYHH